MINFFNIRKQTLLLGVAVGLTFSACDNSERCCKADRKLQANLIDSAVEGVVYHCGDIIEKTDKSGALACEELPVSFYIGKINLGSISTIPADKQIFPQDLAKVERSDTNSSEVRKLALIFQSLDHDNNASNGIKITPEQSTLLNRELKVDELTIESLKEQLLAQDETIVFKDMDKVIEHLNLSLGLSVDSNGTAVGGVQDTNETEESNNTENNTTNEENNATNENNTTDENNTSEENNNSTDENNSTIEEDSTAPLSPTLLVTPSLTKEDSIEVEVAGEANADVYLNDIKVGSLNSEGSLTITLNTSGEDGVKAFNITIQDEAGNRSSALSFELNKDTTPPAKNSTINAISTDDTTPALSGNLPYSEDDKDTKKYKVVLDINGTEYEATNNQNGKWSIDDDVISELNEGFFSVTITVTDEAGNSSSTKHINKIEINNTGFLIDSAVEGIKYISGKYSGYTDINGLFKYEKGAGVTFYIGDEGTGISMGTAETKVDPHNKQRKIITLFDLSGSQDENNFKTVNMGRFLQTFDTDGDVSNGITIDSKTKESIALLGLRNLNFDVDEARFAADSKLQDLLDDLSTHFGGHIRLLSDEDAKAHLVAVRDNTEATKGLSQVVKVRGAKEEVKVLTGVFKSTSGVVEGLNYRCGNQFGKTNANGEFKYEEDKKVKFSISQLSFGTAQGDAVVTPANLVVSTSFDHPRPRNIIRLLSVLDADGNSANGIQIDNAVREALEKYRFQIDLNLQDGKANAELNIPQGVDEFGAQFEDFEIGKEILDEIQTVRAGA